MRRRTALVTGASQGIGFELAKILASKGYDLVLIARNKSKLEEIRDEFNKSFSINVHVIICDLSQVQSAEAIYDEVRKKDLNIDILINNAGIGDW